MSVVEAEKIIKHLAYMLQTIIRVSEEDGTISQVYQGIPEDTDSLVFTEGLRKKLCENPGRIPLAVTCSQSFYYMSVRVGTQVYILGPFRSTMYFDCSQDCSAELTEQEIMDLSNRIQAQSFRSVLKEVLLLSNLVSAGEDPAPDEPITPEQAEAANRIRAGEDEQILSEVTRMVFNNLETSASHNPYDEEIREMAAVERGDEELLRQIIAEHYTGNVGTLAKDPLRHHKNLGIVINTLSCRAGIRGGIPYEVAFSMSDRFIQEMEEQKTIRDVDVMARAAEFEFARTVNRYREAIRNKSGGGENEHVERCKEYIFRHLHGRIRVSEIAESLAINSNYLSTVFKKSEGITITEYILRQKLMLVRNMLIYSEYSYLEITNYLGFPSQSYLGKRFKEETGMTLREFRTRYRVRGFSGVEE